MGQGQGVLDSFGACPMVRHALAMTACNRAGSGIANFGDAVSSVFVTPDGRNCCGFCCERSIKVNDSSS
jgi:hypothetical protein